MKKILIYSSILLNLSINICSMEESKIQEPLFLAGPDEIKLHIFETLIKNIIKNNSIFEPYNNIKKTIENITLVNKEFNNLKFDLIKFASRYIKKHFARSVYNLPQNKKDDQLKGIFIDMLNGTYRIINPEYNAKLEIEIAKLIIAGANINLKINHNIFHKDASLLMIIAKTGVFKNLIKLLISRGAGISTRNNHGDTALIVAAINGRQDIVELFISEGADVNTKDKKNVTALMKAARLGHEGIVKLLIDSGADINAQNNHNYTALMLAASNGYTDIVKLLVAANADINMQNKYGKTALKIAEIRGYTETVELLKPL